MNGQPAVDDRGRFNLHTIIEELSRREIRHPENPGPAFYPDAEFGRRLVAGHAILEGINGAGVSDAE